MKKLLMILFAGSFLIITSCNSKKEGGMSAAAKKNLDAHHAITKCFETKDFSKLGDYMAEDAVDHAGENGDVKGLANIKAEMEKMMSASENMKGEVIKELADDDYVMSWMRYTGTMKMDMMGMKAGDKFDSKSMEVSRYKDGKAVEHWTLMEPAETMKMMGGAQPPVMDNKTEPAKDSTSK